MRSHETEPEKDKNFKLLEGDLSS